MKSRKNHSILDIFQNFDCAAFFKNPDSKVTQLPLTPLNSIPDLCTIWQKLHLNMDFCFFLFPSLNFFFIEKKTNFKWNFVIILTLIWISTYLSNQIMHLKTALYSYFYKYFDNFIHQKHFVFKYFLLLFYFILLLEYLINFY